MSKELSNLLNNLSDTDKDIVVEDYNEYKNVCKDNSLFKYIPPIIGKRRRIVAIGDLHGDWALTLKILKIAKVIDDDKNWIGKDTIVVQVGDQIDRCRPWAADKRCDMEDTTKNDEGSDEKIMMFMSKLNKKASNDGGMVISLLGNHELLNAQGNMNYVSREGLLEYGNTVDAGRKKRIKLFSPGNRIGNFMGCNRLSFVIIGSFIFVHGGITNEIIDNLDLKDRKDLVKINRAVRKWLLTKDNLGNQFRKWLLSLINTDNINQIITGEVEGSIFWSRILGTMETNKSYDSCKYTLDKVLKLFSLNGMIIGHTPQSFNKHTHSGINSTCDEKVWRTDIGASKAFDMFDSDHSESELRKPQCLEILDDGKTFNILS